MLAKTLCFNSLNSRTCEASPDEVVITVCLQVLSDRSASNRPRLNTNPVQTNITLKREKIDAAVNDLNTLMKQIRIRPHFKGGKPDGLTISGIRSKSIFSEMGLRNGDVIVGVDGNNIETVDDALKLYESLQSATGAQVQIRRRGQIRTIDYKIE